MISKNYGEKNWAKPIMADRLEQIRSLRRRLPRCFCFEDPDYRGRPENAGMGRRRL